MFSRTNIVFCWWIYQARTCRTSGVWRLASGVWRQQQPSNQAAIGSSVTRKLGELTIGAMELLISVPQYVIANRGLHPVQSNAVGVVWKKGPVFL
jgi:hypothetical protein